MLYNVIYATIVCLRINLRRIPSAYLYNKFNIFDLYVYLLIKYSQHTISNKTP